MRYTIEQRDAGLVLGLPSQLAASPTSASFWSALRADLCGLVCDKPSIHLYVDLRNVADTDPHSLFQLRAVIDQVRDLCEVTYLGPGRAVEMLQNRGESPSLNPMLSPAPWESSRESSERVAAAEDIVSAADEAVFSLKATVSSPQSPGLKPRTEPLLGWSLDSLIEQYGEPAASQATEFTESAERTAEGVRLEEIRREFGSLSEFDAPESLAADDPILDELVSALECAGDSRGNVSVQPFHPSLGLGDLDLKNRERALADRSQVNADPVDPELVGSLQGRSVAIEVSWVPYRASEVAADTSWMPAGARRISSWHGSRCSLEAAWIPHQHDRTTYGHGTWLELHAGEIGVVMAGDGSADKLLVLCRREGTTCPMVSPYLLELADRSPESVKAVLRTPRVERTSMSMNATQEQLNFTEEEPSVINTEREVVELI